jgi:hypothetical protein
MAGSRKESSRRIAIPPVALISLSDIAAPGDHLGWGNRTDTTFEKISRAAAADHWRIDVKIHLCIIALLLSAPAGLASQDITREQRVVESFLEGYNRREVSDMLRLVHPGIEWLSLSDSTIAVESVGARQLEEVLSRYFASVPSARSSVEGILAAGKFVTVWERAHWESPLGPRTHTALSVYELENGLIRRIWYYPAQP